MSTYKSYRSHKSYPRHVPWCRLFEDDNDDEDEYDLPLSRRSARPGLV